LQGGEKKHRKQSKTGKPFCFLFMIWRIQLKYP
jgi:hypothetical protein